MNGARGTYPRPPAPTYTVGPYTGLTLAQARAKARVMARGEWSMSEPNDGPTEVRMGRHVHIRPNGPFGQVETYQARSKGNGEPRCYKVAQWGSRITTPE